MTVHGPTLGQLRAVADEFGFDMSNETLAEFGELMAPNIAAYNSLEALPDELPAVRYPRTPGYEPESSDNELDAWARKVHVRGAAEGPLKGRRIVLKDNIALAGVPMTNGASTLRHYVPDVDASVVSRVLDAGGEIVGKAVCEFFSFSGSSHTNYKTRPAQNPHKPGYSPGGSSSGCAALVGGGVVDMAIGGDQGGSIRCASGYSGVVGMKPTRGLVPYTGAMPIELTLDTLGPMTQTVADNALLLEVLAGTDGLDPRQREVRVDRYTDGLEAGARGLRVAVVREGFGHPNSETDVDEAVHAIADRLEALGARVTEVSIPMHLMAPAIWGAVALEGSTELMMRQDGFGPQGPGLYITSMMDAHRGWRARTHELPDTVRLSMLVGGFMKRFYGGHFYGKAQNLGRRLTAAYDAVLAKNDLLLMPTNPMKATPLPRMDAPRSESLQHAFEMVVNTPAFNLTGHPSLNLPCAMREGLPVGAMLVGRAFEERTIYRAANALERDFDWRKN